MRKRRHKSYLVEISLLILLIAILLILGNIDYRDEKLDEQYYNTMVCGGHWPDYKKPLL